MSTLDVSGGAADQSVQAVTAEVWHDVLGIVAAPESDFFDLGGHSILASRLIAQLSARLETAVPLQLLFELPVFGPFCAALDALVATR